MKNTISIIHHSPDTATTVEVHVAAVREEFLPRVIRGQQDLLRRDKRGNVPTEPLRNGSKRNAGQSEARPPDIHPPDKVLMLLPAPAPRAGLHRPSNAIVDILQPQAAQRIEPPHLLKSRLIDHPLVDILRVTTTRRHHRHHHLENNASLNSQPHESTANLLLRHEAEINTVLDTRVIVSSNDRHLQIVSNSDPATTIDHIKRPHRAPFIPGLHHHVVAVPRQSIPPSIPPSCRGTVCLNLPTLSLQQPP